eukprot:TRINITY_DN110660_c0_g1_i1.p1 TRINITY_DN110660_c0_g1~~TRINITY_DN110660_c0_g1_i1.p1  ORF type:complete len:485 (-),score=110.42 TRINITY_DN110660_c0_g1_i1:41-1453(-)
MEPSNPLTGPVHAARRSWSQRERKSLVESFMEGESVTLAGEDLDAPDAAAQESEAASAYSSRQSLPNMMETVRTSTLLEEAYLQELQRQEPGYVVYLRSFQGLFLQFGLFGFYIFLDCSNGIFKSLALKGTKTIPQSIPIFQALIQVIIGAALAVKFLGTSALRDVFDVQKILAYMPIAFIFASAQAFNILAFTELKPGTIKVLGQVRLLQTALLSTFLLGRKYVLLQWTTLLMIVLAAACFTLGRSNFDLRHNCERALEQAISQGQLAMPDACKVYPDEEPSSPIGIFYVFAYIFLSDVGSIVGEKLMKRESEGETPYYVQKAWQEIGGFPCAIVLSFLIPMLQEFLGMTAKAEAGKWWAVEGGLLRNWNTYVLGALVFATLQSFLSGLIVKKMNAVAKLLGKCLSTMLTFFAGDCWLLREREPATVSIISAFSVMLGTLNFMNLKTPKPEAESSRSVAVEMSSRDRAG